VAARTTAQYQTGRRSYRGRRRFGGRQPGGDARDLRRAEPAFTRLGNPAHSSRVQAAVDWFGPIDFPDDGRAARRERSGRSVRPPGPRPGFGPAPAPAPPPGFSPETKYLAAPLAEVPDLVRAANPATYVLPVWPPILLQHGGADPLVPDSSPSTSPG